MTEDSVIEVEVGMRLVMLAMISEALQAGGIVRVEGKVNWCSPRMFGLWRRS